MSKFSKAQIRQIILRAKEDGQSMAQELSHLMRIETPEIARPNLFGAEHCNDQHFTISQSWLGPRFGNRYHEPGNIHWGDRRICVGFATPQIRRSPSLVKVLKLAHRVNYIYKSPFI